MQLNKVRLETQTLAEQYQQTRDKTLSLCSPLVTEDYVVQPHSEVSPPKWHLAHTSWFFCNFILSQFNPSFSWPDKHFPKLFNSYYKSEGEHWLQSQRGVLSRPTTEQIIKHRQDVDKAILALLKNDLKDKNHIHTLVRMGLEHEMQHQELLLMDILAIFAANPCLPTYKAHTSTLSNRSYNKALTFSQFETGNYQFGATGNSFCFDNEAPRHRQYIQRYGIANRPTSNQEYLAFIDDGGYQKPTLWLSDGWDYIQQNHIKQPLYWYQCNGAWYEFSLCGAQPLHMNAPVRHISFYEADAFARWCDMRLPTEYEWEHYASKISQKAIFMEEFEHPNPTSTPPEEEINIHGTLWEWTRSPYIPYPGYQQPQGAMGEYNGKFMCNQMVLRGGSFATPKEHYRHTYRNFYPPNKRWQFSGIRLAKDIQ